MNSRKKSAAPLSPGFITTCIFLFLLLFAGGVFFILGTPLADSSAPVSGNRTLPESGVSGSAFSPENTDTPAAARSDIEADRDSLYVKLGIDIILKILYPENAQEEAAPFKAAGMAETVNGKGTWPDSPKTSAGAASGTDLAASGKGTADAGSDKKAADTVSPAVSRTAPATATDTGASPAASSGKNKKTSPDAGQADPDQKKTATSTDTSAPTGNASAAAAKKDKSEKKSSDSSKDPSEAQKDSDAKASSESEDDSKDDSKESSETQKDSDAKVFSVSKKSDSKTEDSSGKEDDSDPEDSLTKLQKKHIKAWEEFHGYPFTINAALNDYDWECLDRTDDGRLSYKGDDRYTILHGIDVSEFQGKIDWKKVKEAGFDFAFIRAGYRTFDFGDLHTDSRAVKNLRRAKEAGFEVGLYFFSQAVTEEEAREEAQICLDIIEESGVEITLPIAFDPEIQPEHDARINYVSKEQFTENALAFCRKIEKAGYTPAIYANSSTETDILDMSRLDDAVIWYADYNQIPESPYRFTFWQYSEVGNVDGVPEPVTDLNVWFIEKEPSP